MNVLQRKLMQGTMYPHELSRRFWNGSFYHTLINQLNHGQRPDKDPGGKKNSVCLLKCNPWAFSFSKWQQHTNNMVTFHILKH
jgi:hypothetical protein